MIRISTVTPIYNSAFYITQLVEELNDFRNTCIKLEKPFQLTESIFVLDEPIDNSATLLNSLKDKFPFIRVIELARNSGQHPATIAGMLYTVGDWIVTLDEDLQHNPKEISELLKKVTEESNDICYGMNLHDVHSSWLRDKVSKLYKKFIGKLSGNVHIESFSSYRIIRGDIGRAAASVFSFDSYMDICLLWFTNRITTLGIAMKDERNSIKSEEKSGYSLFSLIRHAKRLLMTTKVRMLRMVFLVSLFSFLASLFLIVYYVLDVFQYGIEVRGWASIITTILFFGGLSTLLQGILSEGVTDILLKSKGKPSFFVIDRTKDVEIRNYFLNQ